METLIIFAAIIIFSIVESMARSRKAREDAGQEPPLPSPEELGSLPGREDDSPTGAVARSYEHAESLRSSSVSSQHTMAPGELLAELTRLAGRAEESGARSVGLPGYSPPLSKPEPEPEPEPEAEVERSRNRPARRRPTARPPTIRTPRTRTPVSVERLPGQGIHGGHAEYGTDPSERAPSEQDGLDPLAGELSRDAVTVRRQLLNRGTHALRQAVVLQEVLGPPAAIRRDRFDG
jgi:hypothetical protein